MKKLTQFAIASVFALCSAMAFALDAKVVSVKGKVEVQKNGSWVEVKAGDILKKGDVVSTAFKSGAELLINDTKLSLGPLTRMAVEQLASNAAKDETKLYLDSGSVSANVKKSGGKRVDFKVSSPVATASVRGTDFTMTASGVVSTREGLVSKSAGRKAAVLADGASDFVPADGDSDALTSTTDVSGEFGIPVYAGQTSTTDAVTGQSYSPQQQKESAASGMSSSVGGLSSTEGVSTASNTPSRRQLPSGGKKTGSVVVTVTFED